MVYFNQNDTNPEKPYTDDGQAEADYDDGFDELQEDGIPELSPEERAERTKNRARLAASAGNLAGVIIGTVLILVFLTLIFSIIHFVITDIGRNFSLFRTNF